MLGVRKRCCSGGRPWQDGWMDGDANAVSVSVAGGGLYLACEKRCPVRRGMAAGGRWRERWAQTDGGWRQTVTAGGRQGRRAADGHGGQQTEPVRGPPGEQQCPVTLLLVDRLAGGRRPKGGRAAVSSSRRRAADAPATRVTRSGC